MPPPPADPALDDLRRHLAGRLEVVRELGAGGMATVYLAHDVPRNRKVALKTLRGGGTDGGDRFEREVRIAARLVHPNILPLLDSGVAGELLWYTMPYIEGETLRGRLARETQLPVDEALRLTIELADALATAHASGILHRDIKPENVLLSSGHAMLADFGIARALDDSEGRLTATGIALGTPSYMSPEQSTGAHDVDARSDQYALASVAYEMLAGEPPFTGPTAQVVIARRLSQPAPSARALRPALPEAIDRVLRRALAPIPADRFERTADFAAALREAAREAGRTPAERPRSLRPVVVGGVLVLAAVGGWFALHRDDRPAIEGATRDGSAAIRLAVMPFRLIGDTAERYLAEGITEEVTSTLSNIGGLRVIDRRGVIPYRERQAAGRTIRDELGVDALLEGDVQRAGDSVRVRVRLIETATDESKWSQAWNHRAADVFRVQSEVAVNVASVLRIQLSEAESGSLTRPPTLNPAAYDAYLRARSIDRVDGARVRRMRTDSTIAALERAVALDSTFAQAWARLAEVLVSSVFLFEADTSRLTRADEAIRRALALDGTTALAFKARHDLQWNAVRGWHFAQALADGRRAVALQPSLTAAHNALGSLYFHYGFTQEARRELATSLTLDPSDGCDDRSSCTGFSRPRVARVLWYEQKFDSALAIYEKLPVGPFVWEWAVVLGAAGRAADGLALLDSTRALADTDGGDRAASRALLYAMLGRATDAERSIREAIAGSGSRSHFHHAQFSIACAYARLGRVDEAVEWLRRTAENGLSNYPLFRNDPNLRSLQGVPAYEQLMATLQRRHEAYRGLVRGG